MIKQKETCGHLVGYLHIWIATILCMCPACPVETSHLSWAHLFSLCGFAQIRSGYLGCPWHSPPRSSRDTSWDDQHGSFGKGNVFAPTTLRGTPTTRSLCWQDRTIYHHRGALILADPTERYGRYDIPMFSRA